MKCFGLTDKGRIRKDNQDSFIIEPCEARDCVIVALCDGMGGAKAGGIASQVSNKAFSEYVFGKLTSRVRKEPDYRDMLQRACSEANSVAYSYSQIDDQFSGMGTTIVGGVIKADGNGYIINVGDSRAYHITAGGESIYQVSRDHSLVEELVEFGAITKEQARKHPQRSVITRALGTENMVESDYFELTLRDGDVLLLCSDGLSNIITDLEMQEYAREYPEPELLCRALMSKALNRGARDNVTVLAVMK